MLSGQFLLAATVVAAWRDRARKGLVRKSRKLKPLSKALGDIVIGKRGDR